MNDLHNKSHKSKLFALFAVPLIAFLIVSLFQIFSSASRANSFSDLQQLTHLSIQISTLVHETQKERGVTGIYLSSKGENFTTEILSQRKETDSQYEKLEQLISSIDLTKYNDSFDLSLKIALNEMNKLNHHRQQISTLKVTYMDAIEFYSNLNGTFINIIGTMVHNSSDPTLTRSLIAYVNFLRAKEQAGIERVLISAIFTEDQFLPDSYRHFIRVISDQNRHFQEFSTLTRPILADSYRILSESPYYTDVQNFRNIAHKHAEKGDFGVDPSIWFKTITAKINQLKVLENHITNNLHSKSYALKTNAKTHQWMWITLVIGSTTIAVVFGILLSRKINTTFDHSLQEYRNLFESRSSGMVVVNPKNNRFMLSNAMFSDMLGYNLQEVLHLELKDIHPTTSKNETGILSSEVTAAEISTINEAIIKRKDGSVFTAELSTFPILITEKSYVVININNIDNLKLAEFNALESQRTLQTVLNNFETAIAVIEPETLLPIYLNQMAKKMQQQRHQSWPLWALLDLQCYPSQLIPINSKDTETVIIEDVFHQKSKHWYEIKDRCIIWHDGRIVYLRLLEDINERHNAENQNKRLLEDNRKLTQRNYNLQEAERRELAAELHDQFGQLMVGIMMQSDYIIKGIKDKDNELEIAASYISKTIRTLIGMLKEVTNKLRPIILDQLGLVDALIELTQNWQEISKNSIFQFEARGRIPALLDDVSICLYRVTQEALTNINKHAAANKIHVSLAYNEKTNTSNIATLTLTISDNGIGLSQSRNEHASMGLINIQERIQSIGGKFQLCSEPGKGVKIVATIPIEQPGGDQ